ncbi:MAG: FIST signal transduction protein [Flammeovirgaceae bacterium]
MKSKTAFSTQLSTNAAVEEIKLQLAEVAPKLVIYFASSSYDPTTLSLQMDNAFPHAVVVGCSTSGEITSGKMLDNAIVVSAYSNEVIEDINLQLVENIKQTGKSGIDFAFTEFEKHYKSPLQSLNFTEYVGMVLFDGLSGVEEEINDIIGNKTNISFVGGSAGDDLKFKNTYLYANGKAHQNAVVLILIKPKKGFTILKTQSFKVTDKVLTPTKVNEAQRRVIEFDHQPASKAYAHAIGVTEEELPKFFSKNPLGVVLDDKDPFVRSPHTKEGSDILFFCSLKEGLPLNILEGGDIVKGTKNDLDELRKTFGEISGIINFNCILRTLELKDKKRTDEYGEIFKDIPTVGFSTYGETFIGHVNQTATMLVLK